MTSGQANLSKLTSPLTQLIIDLTVRKMNKDQIRNHYKQGRYAGASDAHVKGYVEMLCG